MNSDVIIAKGRKGQIDINQIETPWDDRQIFLKIVSIVEFVVKYISEIIIKNLLDNIATMKSKGKFIDVSFIFKGGDSKLGKSAIREIARLFQKYGDQLFGALRTCN